MNIEGSRGVPEIPSEFTAVQLQRDTPSSIEIGHNAKQEPTYTVKVYCEAGQEAAAATQALTVVDEVRRQLGLPPLQEYEAGS